jgi:hypothetical protein
VSAASSLSWFVWQQMSPEVHAVVQNAGNFDLSVTDNTEEEKVASTTTNSHGVQ